jgi:ribosome-binding ATPase
MALTVGIVGLPNVGKSTLFNALTNNRVLAANYPFATIEPNTGIVPVPDERLDKLAAIYKPAKVIPASVTFVDIAGLVAGAHKGEGLGNQFLAHIREVNAIVQVVRAFEDANVTHVDTEPDPKRDIGTINTELMLADVATLDNHLAKLKSQAKADPAAAKAAPFFEQIRQQLDEGQILSTEQQVDERLQDLHLLTAKPFIYVINVDEAQLKDPTLQPTLELPGSPPVLYICAQLEAELSDMEVAEAKELLSEYGQSSSGLEKLTLAAYQALGLQSYLTAGPQEVRAWTVPKGASAPAAAGVIHTDFERGFIAAEVVKYADLVAAGSEAAARAAGQVMTCGKDYVVQDGDVIEFRFNV